jgi:putative transposase
VIAKQILNKKTYLLTRCCDDQEYALLPSKLVNQVFAYAVGWASQKYHVAIRAMCVMSNHWHSVLTDTFGKLPEFKQEVHRIVAKCLNAEYRRNGYFWDNQKARQAWLLDDDAIMDKMVYTMMNPVAAGSVQHQRCWPGLVTKPTDVCGRTFTIKRPKVYFRDKGGTMPDEVTLTMTRPEIYQHLSDKQFTELLQGRIAEREKEIHDDMRAQKRWFMGNQALKRLKHTDSPGTKRKRGHVNPKVASKNKKLRITALEQLKCFADAYDAARLKWKSGLRGAVLPAGNDAMRRFHRVPCETFT